MHCYKSQQLQIKGKETKLESYYHWANDRLISETRNETTNDWIPSSEPVGEFTHDLKVSTKTTILDYLYGSTGIIGFELTRYQGAPAETKLVYHFV